MSFIPNVFKKREKKEHKHRTQFAEYLKNRIAAYQALLDNEEFEDEDEAVHLTQHIQRLVQVIDEINKANMQGQEQRMSAM